MAKKKRLSLKWPADEALMPALETIDHLRTDEVATGRLTNGQKKRSDRKEGLFAPDGGEVSTAAEAFHRSPVPLLILDGEGVVEESNESAATLLARSLESIRGSRFLDFFPASKEREQVHEQLRMCGRQGNVGRIEIPIIHPEQKRVRVEVVISSTREQSSGFLTYCVALIDVTGSHRAKLELHHEIQALRAQLDNRAGESLRLKKELAEVKRERQRLEIEIIETSEREKRKFGQHLHDETCQSLTGLSFLATVLARKLADQPENHAALEDLARELKKVVDKTRDISWALDPVILNGGLIAALRVLIRQTEDRVPCKLIAPEDVELPDPVALALFRIAKEAVQNAVRHADPSTIALTITWSRQKLTVTIEDDGCGITVSQLNKDGALGIPMMRYRARSVGVELAIENRRSGGTTVRCVLPCVGNGNGP